MAIRKVGIEFIVDTSKMGPGVASVRREMDGVVRGADQAERSVGGLGVGLKTLGTIAAATAGAAAIGALVKGLRAINDLAREGVELYGRQEQAQKQIEQGLISTGAASGFVAGELFTLAKRLQDVTTFGDETILEMQGVLLTFTKLGRDVLPRATEAVLDISTRMGTDLRSNAVQVGKALNDPIRGLDGLSRSGIQFSDSQKEVIKTLASTGKLAEAQGLVLEELENQFGGAARAARETAAGAFMALGNATGDLKEEIGRGLAPALADIADQLTKIAGSHEAVVVMRGFGAALGVVVESAAELAKDVGPLLLRLFDPVSGFGRIGTLIEGLGKRAEALAAIQEGIDAVFGRSATARAEVLRMQAEAEEQVAQQAIRNRQNELQGIEDAIEAKRREIDVRKDNISAIREEFAAIREGQERVEGQIGDASAGPLGGIAGQTIDEIIDSAEAINNEMTDAFLAGLEALEGQQAQQLLRNFGDDLKFVMLGALDSFIQTGKVDFQQLAAGFGQALGFYLSGGSPFGAALGGIIGGAFGGLFGDKGPSPSAFGGIEAGARINEITGEIVAGLDGLSKELERGLLDVLGAIEGSVFDLPALAINIRNDGERFQAIVEGEIIGTFGTAAEAVGAALREGLRRGDLFGVSDEVRQVIEESTATTLEGLQAQLEVAQQIADLRDGVGATGLAIRSLNDQLRETAGIARGAGLSAIDLFRSFAEQLRDLRRQITGEQADPFQIFLDQLNDFNLGIERVRQQYEEELQRLQAQLEIAQQQAGRMGELGEEFGRGMRRAAESVPDLLARIAEIYALLEALPEPIAPTEYRRGGGKGKQRRELRERLREQAEGFGLGDTERQIFTAERAFAEFAAQLEEARFPAEEHARLLAMATEQREREIEAIRRGVRERVEDFGLTGPAAELESQLRGISRTAEQLAEDIRGLGLSMEEEAALLDEVTRAQEDRIASLRDETELGAQQLFADLLEAAGREEEAADLRWRLELQIYELELARYRAEFELFGLATDILDEMAGILGEVRDLGPPSERPDAPDIRAPERRIASAVDNTAREIERLREAFRRAKDGIREFLGDLGLGQFGGVSPQEAALFAEQQFEEQLRLARTGDITALQNITRFAADYLQAKRITDASSPEFQRVFEYVRESLGGLLNLTTARDENLVISERMLRVHENHSAISDRGFAINSEQNERMILLLKASEEKLARIEAEMSGSAAAVSREKSRRSA